MTSEQSPVAIPEALSGDMLANAQNEHGYMSLVVPDTRLRMYRTYDQSAEISDFELEADNPQALLAGQLLLSNLEKQARELGIKELLVTSGLTTNKTAVEFWNRVFGKPIATAEDYDGLSFDRFIWRKQLND